MQQYNTYQVPVEKFGGEDDEDDEEFLDSLELTFTAIDEQVPDEAKRERAKLAALHRHLTGQARDSWKILGPTNKATYALAAAAPEKTLP